MAQSATKRAAMMTKAMTKDGRPNGRPSTRRASALHPAGCGGWRRGTSRISSEGCFCERVASNGAYRVTAESCACDRGGVRGVRLYHAHRWRRGGKMRIEWMRAGVQ